MSKFNQDGLVFDYDDEADVLYITDPVLNTDPIADMNDKGVIIRRNGKKKICGITILDFMKRIKGGERIQTHLHADFQLA